MSKCEYVTISNGTAKSKDVDKKSFVMIRAKDGRWTPRDPTWPLSGPASIAKTKTNKISKAAYDAEKAKEKGGKKK